jgi:hypothetical protein
MEKALQEFKTKQIKDFMFLNYGIVSRKEHMESVQGEDETTNETNDDDDQFLVVQETVEPEASAKYRYNFNNNY